MTRDITELREFKDPRPGCHVQRSVRSLTLGLQGVDECPSQRWSCFHSRWCSIDKAKWTFMVVVLKVEACHDNLKTELEENH